MSSAALSRPTACGVKAAALATALLLAGTSRCVVQLLHRASSAAPCTASPPDDSPKVSGQLAVSSSHPHGGATLQHQVRAQACGWQHSLGASWGRRTRVVCVSSGVA